MLFKLIKSALRARSRPRSGQSEPGSGSAYEYGHALRAFAEQQWSRAETLLRARIVAQADDVDAKCLLGTVLLRAGRSREALDVLKAAAEQHPEEVVVWFNLGTAWSATEQHAAAREAFEAAVRLQPTFAPGWVNLGLACKVLGELGAADEALRRAVLLAPTLAEAWHNLGSTLGDMGASMRHEALVAFEHAIALDQPSVLESRFSRALTLLAVGDLPSGWGEVDVRIDLPRWRNDVRPYAVPFWHGEALTGLRIWVWSEQGVGDEILHASMYEELIERSGVCVIECRHKLVPLFQRSFPKADVRSWRQPVNPDNAAGFDFQVPAASLGRYLRPTLASFPTRSGYLLPDAGRVARWRERLESMGAATKIGFSWRSSDMTGERGLACAALNEWRPVFAEPNTCFVCLQYGDCEAEIEDLRRAGFTNVIRIPDIDYFNDLDEVGALMAALDLVISAPNAVSVQAAALGVPTWQLTYGMDWQTHGTSANPWLPCLRRFERRWFEPWRDTLFVVARELRMQMRTRAGS